jgi:hypothetical protein
VEDEEAAASCHLAAAHLSTVSALSEFLSGELPAPRRSTTARTKTKKNKTAGNGTEKEEEGEEGGGAASSRSRGVREEDEASGHRAGGGV